MKKNFFQLAIFFFVFLGVNRLTEWYLKPNSDVDTTVALEEKEKENSPQSLEHFRQQVLNTELDSESHVVLKNEKVEITFSPLGARIISVRLPGYHSYDDMDSDLEFVRPGELEHTVSLPIGEGESFNSRDTLFDVSMQPYELDGKVGQKLIFTYKLPGEGEEKIQICYVLLNGEYGLDYNINCEGIGFRDDKRELSATFLRKMHCLEKDSEVNSKEALLYYRSENGKVNYLRGSKKEDQEQFVGNITWIASRQHYFTTGFIPKTSVDGCRLAIDSLLEGDQLKESAVQFVLNGSLMEEQGYSFQFYFGPNKYSTLDGVAQDFRENLYLGPAILKHVNRYVILPISEMLEGYIPNFMIVFLIILMIFKLLQIPFSYYKHILSIKRKLLKPRILEIKEKFKNESNRASVEENELSRRAGLFSLWIFFGILVQVPIFGSLLSFTKYFISFRQVSFFWIEDISTYDTLIKLPFRVFFLGDHLSLTPIILSLVSVIPFFLKSGEESSAEQEICALRYFIILFPLIFWNSQAAAFLIYRIFTQIIDFILEKVFKYTIDEEPFKKDINEALKKNDVSSGVSRSQARLQKRKIDKRII